VNKPAGETDDEEGKIATKERILRDKASLPTLYKALIKRNFMCNPQPDAFSREQKRKTSKELFRKKSQRLCIHVRKNRTSPPSTFPLGLSLLLISSSFCGRHLRHYAISDCGLMENKLEMLVLF